jgi:hypothetical protein
MRNEVEPNIKCEATSSRVHFTLDARSHTEKAGVAQRRLSAPWGGGGQSTDAGGSQEINCEATLFSTARKRLLCWRTHPFSLI